MKTFYIETFGCQMNAHDSEKVIGTLVNQGYSQVATPEEAELVFYNTCSIRDKAEQKVFHRLDQFKAQFKRSHGSGKTFAVLGCVAQQEGEKIFERAPHVSLVCGSASYNQLPQMLVQLEAGNRRVTGLSLDTEDTFDTPLTRRGMAYRAGTECSSPGVMIRSHCGSPVMICAPDDGMAAQGPPRRHPCRARP